MTKIPLDHSLVSPETDVECQLKALLKAAEDAAREMNIPAGVEPPDTVRGAFRRMRNIRDSLVKIYTRQDLAKMIETHLHT